MRIGKTAKISAALAAGFAAVVTGCAGFGPQTDGWVPPPVGGTWEMAQRNTGSYGKDVRLKITRGDTIWNGAPAITLTNSLGATIISQPADGRWIALLGPDGKPAVSFDPPIGWQWPLQVGKTWTSRHLMTMHASGKSIDYEFSCNVEDFEPVTVGAGTFDAFRVKCKSNVGSDETYWSSPGLGPIVKTKMLRDAKHPFGPGTQESELVAKSF